MNAELEQIESRLHHDLNRQTWLGRTMGYSQRRLVKDYVGCLRERRQQVAVADIAMYQTNRSSRRRALQVFGPSANHVVQGNDFDTALVAQQIDDVGADESSSASHQNALSLQMSQHTLLFTCSTGETSLSKPGIERCGFSENGLFQLLDHFANLLLPKLGVDRKRKQLIGQ